MVEVSPDDSPRFPAHGKVVTLGQKPAQFRIGVGVAAGSVDGRIRLEAVFGRREADGRLLALVFVAWRGFDDDDSVGAFDDSAIPGLKIEKNDIL